MSRTDAHVPFYVRLARGDLSAQPQHARIHSACDLPDLEATVRYPWRTTGCFWEFFYTGVNQCPCLNCHGGSLARARNRAERHSDRATLRTALNAWRRGDGTAFDAVVPPNRRAERGTGIDDRAHDPRGQVPRTLSRDGKVCSLKVD